MIDKITSFTPGSSSDTPAKRPIWSSLRRGFLCRCPACGKAPVFGGYLKVKRACAFCSEDLHHHRADDAPAYFTLFVVGHIVVGLALGFEVMYTPPMWLHIAVWSLVSVIFSLVLLRSIKGGIVALQWALYMHGFGEPEDELELEEDVG